MEVWKKGRNGNVLTVIGSAMHFDLSNNTIPLLTTKKVAWKTCCKEYFGLFEAVLVMKNFKNKM